MNVSGPGNTGALALWNTTQRALGPPREHSADTASPRSSRGRQDAGPQPGAPALAYTSTDTDEKRNSGGLPAVPRPAGDPRALAQFFAHGLEPARIGTLIDTYA